MKINDTALIALQKPQQKQEDPRLKEAVQDFEAFFVAQMLKDMRKVTEIEGGLFENSSQEKVMRDFLDEEWSREIAGGQGLGLARVLYRQLQSQQ